MTTNAGKPAKTAKATKTTTIAKLTSIDPEPPDPSVVQAAVDVANQGGILAFPTDTLYGIGCLLSPTAPIDRIARMRGIDMSERPFTLMLPDVGALPHYARLGETAYEVVNRIFPGPYCVELAPSPRMAASPLQAGRETIGVRIPANAFCQKLLWRLGRPLVTVTAKDERGQLLSTAAAIAAAYGKEIDLVVDGGTLDGLPSTVVSLVDDWVTVLREGRGQTDKILLVTPGRD